MKSSSTKQGFQDVEDQAAKDCVDDEINATTLAYKMAPDFGF